MKKITTGSIFRLFKMEDKDTILRKTNIRAFCIRKKVKHVITQNICLIDLQSFMDTVNPRHIDRHYNMPRLRTKIGAQNEWNSCHRKKIKHHIIDQICDSEKVFVYKNGRYNVINYDELETELIKELKKRGKY